MRISFRYDAGCNWNCDYCTQRNNTTQTEEQVINWIDTNVKKYVEISKASRIQLIGGEPGMWSNAIWLAFSNALKYSNAKVSIFTNGLVFENKIAMECFSKAEFLWHVNISLSDKVKKSYIYTYLTNRNIKPLVVIDKKNLLLLDQFIKNNSWIKEINTTMAVYPPIEKYNNLEFNNEEIKTFIEYCYKEPKIIKSSADEAILKLECANKDVINSYRKVCSTLCKLVYIDIGENCIYACCNRMDKIELTKENFINYFFKKIPIKTNYCDSCFNYASFKSSNRELNNEYRPKV